MSPGALSFVVIVHRAWTKGRVVTAACMICGCCLADISMEQHLSKGADLLARGESEAALQEFDAAAISAPRDGEVRFFQGVAHNRLGRFPESEGSLRSARRLGCGNSDLDFELGWSLLGSGKWPEALESLEAYEVKHPGRGQTREFMGRAHFAMGDVVLARRMFDEALIRDPDLKPTVRAARELMAEADPPLLPPFSGKEPPAYALHGSLVLGVGYNTNILGLSDDFQRLPGFPELESAFLQVGGDVALEWQMDPKTILVLKGGVQWVSYDTTSVANLLDVTAGVDVRRWLTEQWMGRMQFDFDYARLGGDPFRTAWQVRPSLSWRQCDMTATELGVSFAISDYSFPLPASLDRDALSYGVDLTQHFSLVGGKVRAIAGGFVRWDVADGEEFTGRFAGLRAGVAATLPGKIDAEVFYALVYHHFDHPSMLSIEAANRRGTAHAISAQFSRPLGHGVSVYLRYSYQIANSNVSFYEYDQHLWMAGLRVRL